MGNLDSSADMSVRKKSLVLLFLFGVMILFSKCILSRAVLYYATNDDYRMQLILSGRYTGRPSSESVFLNPLLGMMLAGLYRRWPSGQWYGWFHLAGMCVSAAGVASYFVFRARSRKTFFLRLLIVEIFVSVIYLKSFLMPQFTVTAAYWGTLSIVSGLSCRADLEHGRKKAAGISLAVFVLSSVLSVMIRYKVFYLSLPVLFSGLFFMGMTGRSRKIFGAGLFVTLLVAFSLTYVYKTFPNTDNYKAYREYNRYRSKVYDYYEIPDYKEYEDFYTEIGLSENDWRCLTTRSFDVTDKLTLETLKKVYAFQKEINRKTLLEIVTDIPAKMVDFVRENTVFREFLALFLALGLSWFLVRGGEQGERSFLCAGCLYMMAVMCYLLFLNRLIGRMAEVLILYLFGAVFSLEEGHIFPQRKRQNLLTWIRRKAPSLAMLGLLVFSVEISAVFYLADEEMMRHRTVEKNTLQLQAMEKYMKKHKNRLLLYNRTNFYRGTGLVLDPESRLLNVDSIGNWNAFSDTYYERNELFGFHSALEGLKERKIYYAELLEDLHSPFRGILRENGYRLKKKKSIQVGEDTITIYYCKPLKK